jgi:hypothetical protein
MPRRNEYALQNLAPFAVRLNDRDFEHAVWGFALSVLHGLGQSVMPYAGVVSRRCSGQGDPAEENVDMKMSSFVVMPPAPLFFSVEMLP